ncbi:cubilin-like [Ptychodera flava]|uniref:cubilin-like n=1 Tax=Ptychodera flava TaxID=63121 RepID=UPI003969D101
MDKIILLFFLIASKTYVISQQSSSKCEENFYNIAFGHFTTPNYPDYYGDNRRCHYSINIPRVRNIVLAFIDFDVEAFHDFVQIGTGEILRENAIINYTAEHFSVRPSMEIASDLVWLTLTSDSSYGGRGFDVAFYQGPHCGENFYGINSGHFTSPNYPSNYGNNLTCHYIISIPEAHSIRVTFLDYDVESLFDFVQVGKGPISHENTLINYTTDYIHLPPPLEVASDFVWLVFRSDFSIAKRGFYLTFSAGSNCDETFYGTNSGHFTSPNYPTYYGNNLRCHYIINIPGVQSITLEFINYDVEKMFDFVQVGKGPISHENSLINYTADYSPVPPPLEVASDFVWLIFSSDSSVGGRGFSLTFSAGQNCGKEFYDDSFGRLTSPNYPEYYANDLRCQYIISIPGVRSITLEFHDYDVEPFLDFVQVGKGPISYENSLINYTADYFPLPPPLEVASDLVWLIFSSDSSVAGRGFVIQYSSDSKCGGNFYNAPTDGIVSPSYPHYDDGDQFSCYEISIPDVSSITLTFNDYDIRDGLGYIGIGTGQDLLENTLFKSKKHYAVLPPPLEIASDYVWIVFASDGSVKQRGFNMTYSSESNCGKRFYNIPNGYFSSADCSSNNCHKGHCNNVISIPGALTIKLVFVDFDMGSPHNYVEIGTGLLLHENILFRYDKLSVPPPRPLAIASDTVWVTFHNESSIDVSSSFKIAFSEGSYCGKRYQDVEKGYISSSDCTSDECKDAKCNSIIHMREAFSIKLKFVEFDMRSPNDYIEVGTGLYINDKVLFKYNSSSQPLQKTLEVATDAVWISFHTYRITGFVSRFNMTFSKGAPCGGRSLNQHTGKLRQKGKTTNYVDDEEAHCVYFISIPDALSISLDFNFGLSRHAEISCGEARHGNLVKRYNDQKSIEVACNMILLIDRPPPERLVISFSVEHNCGRRIINQRFGHIVPSNLHNAHSDDLRCLFYISIPDNRLIFLIFNFFDLEHDQPYIEIGTSSLISDPDSRLHRFTASSNIQYFIEAKADKVWIKIYTGQSEASQGINITYSADPMPPTVPKITIDNDPVTEGDRLILTCHSTGIPPPDYKWYYNGEYLNINDKQYTIAAASVDDSGEYSCTATNEENTTRSSIYVDVLHHSFPWIIIYIAVPTVLCLTATVIVLLCICKCRRKRRKEATTGNEGKIDNAKNIGDENCYLEPEEFIYSELDIPMESLGEYEKPAKPKSYTPAEETYLKMY